MADGFTNPPIPTGSIPRLSDDDFVGVDPRHLQIGLTQLGAFAVLVVAAATVLVVAVPRAWITLVAASGALVLLGGLAALVVVEHRRLGYQLRAHDVSLRSGAISRRVETIPFSRVQHVTVNRSPLERLAGLATLEVSSAGPDLAIPGLPVDDATRIRRLIVERAGVDDAEPDPPPAA